MLNISFFGQKKLLLSFEYGMYIAQVAQKENVELTKEFMEHAEEIILKEFQKRTPEELARDMGQTILTIFQPEN
jgi:hypothetical protein